MLANQKPEKSFQLALAEITAQAPTSQDKISTQQPEFVKIFTLAGVFKFFFSFSDLRVDEQPNRIENIHVRVDRALKFYF